MYYCLNKIQDYQDSVTIKGWRLTPMPSHMDSSPGSVPHSNELRVLGLLAFISIWLGAAIAVYELELLWDRSESTYQNVLQMTMTSFTFLGVGFFTMKMFLQEGMDSRASITRVQRAGQRRMQQMQSGFAQKQLEVQMQLQELELQRQIDDLVRNGSSSSPYNVVEQLYESTIPTHKADVDEPLDLGQKRQKPKRDASGKFAKKEKGE